MSILFMQVAKLSHLSHSYPELLREIVNKPKELYMLGDLPMQPAVAIVGTRRPTQYGRDVTYRLARELAGAGIVIVSGLAYGLDAVAHRAALDAGGKTIAVLANGLDQVYPVAHRELAAEILTKGGAIVSERPEGTPPLPPYFAARNRIISGLSLGVLVTEATAESGTLITARFANEQNRLVMATPGSINAERSAGPNNLIKDGAIVITNVVDVLSALNFDTGIVAATPVRASNSSEAKLLELIQNGVTGSQALIDKSGYSAPEFANIISLMEITGKIVSIGAGHWGIHGRLSKNPAKAGPAGR
jgi:DNA processing protein